MKFLLSLVVSLGCAVGSAEAFNVSWQLGTETDLAGYELWRMKGACGTGGTWAKVKTVGVVNHTTWTPVAPGQYCVKIRVFNTHGLFSPFSARRNATKV